MQTLIDRYSNLVWCYVHSFARKFDGFKNSPMIDKDDLYQECMADLIDAFLQSGQEADVFHYDHMRIFHTMHVYVKKCLPVKTTVRTSDYTKTMRKFSNTDNVDDRRDLSGDVGVDPDFKLDCDLFESRLPDEERRIFRMLRMQAAPREIQKALGIDRNRLTYERGKIARKYGKTHGIRRKH